VESWTGARAVDDLREALSGAMTGAQSALDAADRLCRACVEILEVDGASISVAQGATTSGTFGSSGELSRRLDEYQFTFGEGPCLDAVRQGVPVLAPDLGDRSESRWPAFAEAVLSAGISAVFALPVGRVPAPFGALDLFRRRTGSLSGDELAGSLIAAELAALPLLDVMGATEQLVEHAEAMTGWDELASLERVEVYQATGMIMVALDVDTDEALVRLRGYAFAHGLTASEAAWLVLDWRVNLHDDSLWGPPGPGGGQT